MTTGVEYCDCDEEEQREWKTLGSKLEVAMLEDKFADTCGWCGRPLRTEEADGA